MSGDAFDEGLRQAVAQLDLRTLIGELRKAGTAQTLQPPRKTCALSGTGSACHKGPSAEYCRGRRRVRKVSMTSAGRWTMPPIYVDIVTRHTFKTALAMQVYALLYPGNIRYGPADARNRAFTWLLRPI